MSAHPSLAGATVGSTWYCPAAGAGTPEPLAHHVTITNPERHVLNARLTAYKSTAGTPPRTVQVPALSQLDVTMSATEPGGVVVELIDGRGTVSHRLFGSNADETGRCTDTPSATWYFPAANTELGSSAALWLLNPFPTDASVNISIATPDGVRIPPALDGVVIAGGTSRRIDLAESAQRRPQFAFSVVAKSGQIVAELAEVSDVEGGAHGLRMQMGVAEPHDQWLFADGFGGKCLFVAGVRSCCD